MSNIQAYWLSSCGDMDLDQTPDSDSWCNYDAAQSELAALREELATAKRNEHNSEVAYKAAIEKQGELREELENSECMRENNRIDAKIYKDSLAAAEQRNAELASLLREGLEECKDGDDWIERTVALLGEVKNSSDDSAYDRAYRNGLMQGYNLALNGSEKEYQDAVARYSKPTESGASE